MGEARQSRIEASAGGGQHTVSTHGIADEYGPGRIGRGERVHAGSRPPLGLAGDEGDIERPPGEGANEPSRLGNGRIVEMRAGDHIAFGS